MALGAATRGPEAPSHPGQCAVLTVVGVVYGGVNLSWRRHGNIFNRAPIGTDYPIASLTVSRIKAAFRFLLRLPCGSIAGIEVEGMSQFYAKAEDEERCLQSSITRQPVMVQGLTTEGKLRPFSGTVQAVEKGHTQYPDYPLRISMK